MSAIRDNFNSGQAGASSSPAASSASTAGGVGPPAWAKAMKRRQAMMHGASVATHTLRSGDSHGGGAGPKIKEKARTHVSTFLDPIWVDARTGDPIAARCRDMGRREGGRPSTGKERGGGSY